MRRSRSPSWPVMSACSGALKPSAAVLAGMSWTTPSVIMKTPGDLLGRHVGEAGVEAGEELRALVAAGLLPGLYNPDVDVAQRGEARLQAGERRVGLRRALADRLRAGPVDDDCDDLLQGRPILAGRARDIKQGEQHQREPNRPQPDGTLPKSETEPDDGDASNRETARAPPSAARA